MNRHYWAVNLCEVNANTQDGDLLVDEDTAGASAGESVAEREHFVQVLSLPFGGKRFVLRVALQLARHRILLLRVLVVQHLHRQLLPLLDGARCLHKVSDVCVAQEIHTDILFGCPEGVVDETQ